MRPSSPPASPFVPFFKRCLVLPLTAAFAVGCAHPVAQGACTVIDLAKSACDTIVVRLEDGRTVDLPKAQLRAVSLAAAAGSSTCAPSAAPASPVPAPSSSGSPR